LTPESRRMRILHVITELGTGGAEAMLYKLLQATDGVIDVRVLSLMEGGSNARRIEALGVQVDSLGMGRGSMPGPATMWRLRQVVREFLPDLVQGWMYHGNLAAWLAVRLCAPRPRLSWNLRQTVYDIRRETKLTRWLIRLGARLSPAADKIIYNSEVSAQQHESAGYAAGKRVVIPNGFDVGVMEPRADARQSVREEFGLAPDTLLVGQVARYHPMKGHLRMLQAAASVVQSNPHARFLLVGHGVTPANTDLAEPIHAMGLEDNIILAGERAAVARLMAGMDVMVSASEWGEGFPNVLGEAMAVGVPCVATDVGDSARVIGDCGILVAAGNPAGLATAIKNLLAMTPEQRNTIGLRARERVRQLYSMDQIAGLYMDVYQGGTR
jgi:glycosyltransferase involved in cell wall biosynthesis